jgi:cytochrome P450
MDKAGWHEFLVYALNRPLAFAIIRLAARLGQAAHLPPIGTFVNDAEIAREVLTDTAHFDSHSPGSLGVLLTQALGSYALLNMDGPEHRQLKRRLLDVFSTKYISVLLNTVTDPLVAGLRAELAAGRTVDFVAFMKTFASAMACAMVLPAKIGSRTRSAMLPSPLPSTPGTICWSPKSVSRRGLRARAQ